MHSTAIILGLMAASVLSMPHGAHKHARQVEVVDVVDVYTTVFLNGPVPAATPAPSPKAAAPATEEKVAEPVHHQPAKVASAAPPPPPPASSAAPPPPPASSAPASAPSSGNAFLDQHNKYRAAHGAAPMEWDDDLAAKAQGQANSCPNGDVQTGSNWYGISVSQDSDTASSGATSAWYGEMDLYAQRSNNYASNPPNDLPSNAPESGHFSQMIWNDSTKLGCGVASNCGSGMKTQVTCLYTPVGNMLMIGQPSYPENVFPLGGKAS